MSGHQDSGPHRLLPIALVVYLIAGFVVTDLYLPSLPAIARDFSTPDTMAQASLTLFLLGFAFGNLVFGPLSDRHGRRPILIVGGLGFLAATLACAVAPSAESFVLARLAQGGMVASIMVVVQTLVRELYDDTKVVKVMAFIAMVEAVSPALAPVAGAEIALAFDWRANFWIVLFAGAAALALVARMAPESLPPARRSNSNLTGVMLTYARLARRWNLMAPLLAAGFVFGGLMLYLTVAPFYFVDTLGLGERDFAIAQFACVLCYVAGLMMTSRLSDKVRLSLLIGGGFVAAAIGGLGMVASALIFPEHVLTVTIPFAIFAFGIGLAMAPLITEALSADPTATGTVAAIIGVVTIGCAFIGSVLAASAYQGTALSMAWPLAVTAVIAVGLFVSKPKPQVAPAE
ncbi:MAG: multidrug effflux MFS transporter [Pseudomonadota bacterium]